MVEYIDLRKMIRTKDKDFEVKYVVFMATKTIIIDEIVQGEWERVWTLKNIPF